MLIDTHAHLNFRAFENDFDEVIKRSLGEGVWMINVGSKYETSRKAAEIAEQYSNGAFAALALHPIHAADEEFEKERYRGLAESNKVVAIGETGLDYFKDYGKFREKQKQVFLEHLNLAKELNLPVIIHCRMAHDDVIKILKDYNLSGVIHCFVGTWEEAKKYLDLGFYIGINGIIYKTDLKEVIKKIPLERILIETDSPYLIPPLARRSPEDEGGRNEPIFVRYIAEDVARIKVIDFETVALTTFQNAIDLFVLDRD